MFHFHLPDPLYRYMPFLYVVTGVGVLLITRQPIALFSGLLIIAAGLIVFYSRLENRITTQELRGYKQCAQALTCPNRQKALDGE